MQSHLLSDPVIKQPWWYTLCAMAVLIVWGTHATGTVLTLDLQIQTDFFLDTNGVPGKTTTESLRITVNSTEGVCVLQLLDRENAYAVVNRDTVIESVVVRGRDPDERTLFVSGLDRGYPIDLDTAYYRMPWFVYCAKNYLMRQQGRYVPLPRGDVRRDFGTVCNTLDAAWESPIADLCPATVKFLFNKELLLENVHEFTFESGDYLDARQERLDTWIQHAPANGTTMAEFSVTSWVAVNGLRVPSEWELTTFWFGGYANTRFSGRASHIEVVPRLEVPDVPAVASISDRRLRDPVLGIDAAHYSITNGTIPDVAEAMIIAGMAQRSPTGKRALPSGNLDFRRWAAILFIGILLVPLVWMTTAPRRSEHGD